jgi:UDP-N-acetylmuramoyl-L-alanyl-D-glutamate--2,6-diaminopimelate ligase
MQLSQLIDGFGFRVTGHANVEIADLTDDSRTVTPGSLFIARGGHKADGRKFIADAVSKGAVAVLIEQSGGTPSLPANVTVLTAEKVDHALTSRLAERFFGEPGKKLKLIAITGTKGKTTIAFVIQHLLGAAGLKTGMIGTVLIDDGATRTPAELTTPGGVEFSRTLAAMVKNGCRAAVAEVSSHALHQGRLGGLEFAVGVFTNLTGDHLDYHGTMENYADAKAILFEGLLPGATAVINSDDVWAERMVRKCRAGVLRCTLEGKNAEVVGHVLKLGADSSIVDFIIPGVGDLEVKLPLVGKHNVMNVLQAVAATTAVAPLKQAKLREALEKCPAPPGRLEPVRVPGVNGGMPTVLVDYAHTHDALEKVLTAVRPSVKGKLVVVFGCGGDRDRTKRPKMAAVCCRMADRVIITSDNPRTEDPMFILGQVLTGVPERLRPKMLEAVPVSELPAGAGEEILAGIGDRAASGGGGGGLEVMVHPDRAEAIRLAVLSAAGNDTIVIAGKGHEDYQIIGTTKRHFDDREEAGKALRERLGTTKVA